MVHSVKRTAVVIMAVIMMMAFMPFVPGEQALAAAKSPAKVKITKAEAKGNSLYVTWKKAKGAKKYQIYVKEGKKKFKKYAILKKPQTYRIKNLKWKTSYHVKMRAVSGKKKGKWSTVYKYKFGKKQTLQSIATNQSEIKELEKLERSLEKVFEDLFDARIGFSRNMMYINMIAVQQLEPDQVSDLNDLFSKECETKKFRNSMKEAVKGMEEESGLSGVRINLIFKNNDGSSIYSNVYR